MSHNPNEIKSQDDTTEDELGRTMTLLRAIEQLEKTECELERTEKKLDRAIWWLNEIVTNHRMTPISTAEIALAEIKELDNEDK